MQIKRLQIDDYLCLVDFDIVFDTVSGGSSTILIGENGAGKSTMIESVLNILMSFDSPTIEKQIDYDYSMEYEYAQKAIRIVKNEKNYRIEVDGEFCEGSYRKVRSFTKTHSVFPQRIIAFYSGANNKLLPQIKKMNARYTQRCRNTLESFLKAVSNESDQSLPSFPKRKYNYCDEGMTPIYLVAILCGQDSFEKDYLVNACRFNEIQCMNMVIDTDKVENIFGRGRFDGDMPTGLYYLTDFIDHRITDLLRRGLLYSAAGKSYFEIKGLEKLGLDSIAILEFFEKLYSLFDARFEVTVTQGNSIVKCKSMSEGQRQLIKILGMLGICKTEDCLVLMDEPDAYMNPRWKYDIKSTMDQSLKGAINAQAIIATHDPLVINGVPKEFIRIFTQNKELESSTGFFVTRVITPVEDTEGMGIDGLLQSEYYGLQTSYDQKSHKKFLRRQELYLKLIGGNATAGEKAELREITRDLGLLPLSYNSIDFLYDDFLTVYKKCDLYSQEYLTYDQVLERRGKIKEIIEALYEGQV